MIQIKCSTRDGVLLQELSPFQGNLKVRDQKNVDELKESLLREGLLMPFAIWRTGDKKYLLDGHGRLDALLQLSMEDSNLLEVPFPCVYIEAATEEDARKSLLQITSSYGKITKKGVVEFTANIPDYAAPSISKFVAKPVSKVDVSRQKYSVIKIRVPKEKAAEVKQVLATVDYVEVL